jgi:transcriptional regulator of acetoin/glycerol metabolism
MWEGGAAGSKAISKAAGNWTEAAKLLGRNRTDLYRVLKNLGMTLSLDSQK